MVSPAPPATPNLRLGRYELLFRIAAGGMAEVHVARLVGEGGFEKLVALKRMLPSLAEDERFVGMFLDEGRVAANISSPNVVATLDLGRADDESLFLVMELVVGVSLSALLRVLSRSKTEIPVPLAAEIIAQAALGLHDAHEARTLYGEPLGIVHRDISPQNVLVDVAGRVRITDFGVARAVERVTQTQSGEVKGKLGYFAPEQARAKPVDRRADVYALGIVAWELLAGRRLFAGDGPAETLLRVLEMEIPRLDSIRPDVPKELADAIASALERDLEKRTKTAGDLAQAVRAAVPSVGPSALGQLVRERGGESLLRLEEGIRSQMPSSPSGRLPPRTSKPPRVGDEDASQTPSSISRVVEKPPVHRADVADPGAAAIAPSLPPPPPAPVVDVPVAIAAPAAAPPSSRWIALAGVAVLIAVLAGAAIVLTRPPEVTASQLPIAAPPIAAPIAVPEPTRPTEVAEVVAPSEPVVEEAVAPTAPVVEQAAAIDAPTTRPRDTRPAVRTTTPRAEPTVAHEEPHEAPRTERTRPPRSTEEEETPTHRPSALRGIDDFESELD